MINYPSTPIDLNDIPYPSNSDVQIFIGPTSGSATANTGTYYRTWNKPKGATMLYMIAISGGGGGGGGGIGASGTNRGGGAGGGSSGIATLTIPALFVPDVLYVQPGHGGGGTLGSTSATVIAAGSGGISYVSYSTASSSPINILLQSNAVAPTGGQQGGSGATGTTVGAAGTVATASTGSRIGIFTSVPGQAGTAGGNTTTAGGNLTAWTSIFLSGGTGSGGSAAAANKGGEITPNTITNIQTVNWPILPTGSIALGGNTNVKNGNPGVMIWSPFISSGGTGAGTDGTNSGAGGNGGIGSGGGGSGVSTAGTKGGDGGPGMVMIISW